MHPADRYGLRGVLFFYLVIARTGLIRSGLEIEAP